MSALVSSPALVVLRDARPIDAAVALLPRVVAGDERATRLLLRQLAPGLLRAIRRLLGVGHLHEDDVLQESFLGLLGALSAFRGDSSLQTYANRIAVRTALAWRRRAVERRERDAEHGRDASFDAAVPTTPEDDASQRALRAALSELLDTLPAAQAEALALRIGLDHSLEEVAAATGAPVNTIRSRIRLAREALLARVERDPDLARALGVRR